MTEEEFKAYVAKYVDEFHEFATRVSNEVEKVHEDNCKSPKWLAPKCSKRWQLIFSKEFEKQLRVKKKEYDKANPTHSSFLV